MALNLMDLPDDVVMDILDFVFALPYYERQPAIKNTRLVCRRLNQLASPLLLREWNVHLDAKSLEYFERFMVTNPLVVSGIQKISIIPEYRPATLAANIVRFKQYRWEQVQDARLGVMHRQEALLSKEHLTPNEGIEFDSHNRALKNYRIIQSAWRCSPGLQYPLILPLHEVMEELHTVLAATDHTFTAEETEFRRILYKGFYDFRRRHRKQHRLVVAGTFIESMASAVSRIGHPVSIEVSDHRCQCIGGHWKDPADIFLKENGLTELMTQPLGWRDIETEVHGASSRSDSAELPTRLLSELFVAIAKAGPRPLIKAYEVLECFPVHPAADYSSLEPIHNSWRWPGLQNAAASCSSLSDFRFRMGEWPGLRKSQISSAQLAQIKNFLSPFLSASCRFLKRLVLDFYGLRLHVHDPICFDPFKASSILSLVPERGFPHLKSLYLSDLEVEQSVLERFCATIGDSLQEIFFEEITIDGDSWVNVLDILREAIRQRKSWRGRISNKKMMVNPVVVIDCLWGGEFGSRGARMEEERRRLEAAGRSYNTNPPFVLERINAYVSCKGTGGGDRAINPLHDPMIRTELQLLTNNLDDVMGEGLACLFGNGRY
ncbi:hypothetical protein QBC44DRAFT_308607 [Cladorrhinum sp. PSN332]|nr:hypothetical protein QBC44DRAFT_308607 [Cladorrhinum sp. PSN332]